MRLDLTGVKEEPEGTHEGYGVRVKPFRVFRVFRGSSSTSL